MDAVFDLLGITGTIGLALGLLGVLLLAVVAARLSRMIDLLDEIAELITSASGQPQSEARSAHEEVGQPR